LDQKKLEEIQGLVRRQQNSLKTVSETYEGALHRDLKLREYFQKGFFYTENDQFLSNIPLDLLVTMNATIQNFQNFRLGIFEVDLGFTSEFQSLRNKLEHETQERRRKMREATILNDIEATEKLLKENLLPRDPKGNGTKEK